MPYMYSEMQNKLSKTRESPLESMGQIISSRCPYKSNTINLYATKTCLFLGFLCDVGFNLINIRLENNNKYSLLFIS